MRRLNRSQPSTCSPTSTVDLPLTGPASLGISKAVETTRSKLIREQVQSLTPLWTREIPPTRKISPSGKHNDDYANSSSTDAIDRNVNDPPQSLKLPPFRCIENGSKPAQSNQSNIILPNHSLVITPTGNETTHPRVASTRFSDTCRHPASPRPEATNWHAETPYSLLVSAGYLNNCKKHRGKSLNGRGMDSVTQLQHWFSVREANQSTPILAPRV